MPGTLERCAEEGKKRCPFTIRFGRNNPVEHRCNKDSGHVGSHASQDFMYPGNTIRWGSDCSVHAPLDHDEDFASAITDNEERFKEALADIERSNRAPEPMAISSAT